MASEGGHQRVVIHRDMRVSVAGVLVGHYSGARPYWWFVPRGRPPQGTYPTLLGVRRAAKAHYKKLHGK